MSDQQIKALQDQRDALLEALKAVLEKGKRWHYCDPVVIKARDAIAKAEGGAA